MRTFQEQLDLVRHLGLQAVQQITIDLSIAAADQEYNLSGNFFYVKEAPDQDMYVEVKINGSNNKAIPWTKQMGFIHPFNRLYVTTPAGQTGTMTILIASEAPELFDVVDNRSAISLTMADVLGELQGDVTPESCAVIVVGVAQVQLLAANAGRKGCSICSATINTGNICLGYDNTVTTAANWFHILEPGGSYHIDNYRGPIHAVATVAAQGIGVGEW